MTFKKRARTCFRWIRWKLLSIPIQWKVLGIGGLVALIFGSVTLLQIRSNMERSLSKTLAETTLAMATSLSFRIERALITDDRVTIDEILERTRKARPDLLYTVVQNGRGHIVAKTFRGSVPAGLMDLLPATASPDGTLTVLRTDEGHIFNATAVVLDGKAGRIQLGMSDRSIKEELGWITRSVLVALGLCIVIGQSLALFLTNILNHPIRQLVLATNSIGAGELSARAEVLSGDEIGELALAFNRMAQALERNRRLIEEREAARVQLVHRIIHSQEDERKRIARELHDELGQSLSALLLAVTTEDSLGDACIRHRKKLESRILELIEKSRRMAWNLRPSILDDYGLDSALSRHVQEVSRLSGIKIDYQLVPPGNIPRLERGIEVVLYRIAQEALTNLTRHSAASRASVVLIRSPASVILLVEDDGKGFDMNRIEQRGPSGTLGLLGMKERTLLFEGQLDIESAPGKGTTVRATIPL